MQKKYWVLGFIVVVLLLIGGGIIGCNIIGEEGDAVDENLHKGVDEERRENDVSYKIDEETITLDWGEKPTGGYQITIENLEIVDDVLVVDYSLVSPGEDDIVTQALTYPEDSAPLPDGDFEQVKLNLVAEE